MFDRIGFKLNAKKIFREKNRAFINIAFLSIMVGLAWISYGVDFENRIVYLYIFSFQVKEFFWAEAIGFLNAFLMVTVIWQILVQIPFNYGLKNYFKDQVLGSQEKPSVWIGFRKGYSKIMATEVISSIIIIAGLFCFVVPGIYFMLSYKFVPYLLKDEPELTTFEILKKSKRMVKNHYFDMLFLELSFIPYAIASYITGGLTKLFSVPYKELVYAQVYLWFKKESWMNDNETSNR